MIWKNGVYSSSEVYKSMSLWMLGEFEYQIGSTNDMSHNDVLDMDGIARFVNLHNDIHC